MTYPNAIKIPELNKIQLKNFFNKVEYSEKGCWFWTGCTNKSTGYGKVRINNKDYRPHRVSYHLFKGEIPKNLVIDHTCEVRNCVNPEHLRAITQRENVHAGKGGWNNKLKTHCKLGHAYVKENLNFTVRKRILADGEMHISEKRTCKTCNLLRSAKLRENLKSVN